MIFFLPLPTSGRIYTMLFVVFFFGWPLSFLIEPNKSNLLFFIVSCLINIVSFALNANRTTSVVISYWNGLCYISSLYMTGCVNISIFVVLPILFLVHLITFIISIIGIIVGKSFSQKNYLRLVWFFTRKDFDLQDALIWLKQTCIQEEKGNEVCPHGVKGGKALNLCNLCIQETEKEKRIQIIKQQERVEQVRKENIKLRANELRNAEIERLGKLMTLAKEQSLFSLSPREFEKIMAELYQRLGYSVELTPYTDDHGIDIIAHKDMIHYVIQCKRYKSNNVGRPELMQFYGAMMHEKADQGIFITTSYFTEQAKEFAKGKNIELIGFDKLTLMTMGLTTIEHECIKVMCLECGSIVEFGITERINEKLCTVCYHTVINNITERELSSQAISDKVYCDKCGREMRLIHGRNGKFWGCTGYRLPYPDKCSNAKPYQTMHSK